MGRIFVVRVGTDTQHYPIRSPIFPDRRFEFVPIPEGEKWESLPIAYKKPMLRYRDIRCFNDVSRSLGDYAGHSALSVAHNDPEFDEMTYGDLCDINSRAANLLDNHRTGRIGARQGDYLFFLARLEEHDGSLFTGQAGLYFVGFFHIAVVLGPIRARITEAQEAIVGRNAHVLRAKAEPGLWNDARRQFWVFKGGRDSERFELALKANWEWLSTIFSDASGCPWHEWQGQTRLQRITSYTRTIRCQLDPTDSEQSDRYAHFWDRIRDHLSRTM